MNDPSRLRITSDQVACRLLLESALEDHSAPGAAERALCALSVGAAATAAAVHAGASSSVGGGSQFASGLVVKWLGLGLLAGVTTVVSAEQAVRVVSDLRATSAVPLQPAGRSQLRQAPREAVTASVTGTTELAPPPVSEPAQPRAESHALRAPDPPSPPEPTSEVGAAPLQELHAVRRALAERDPTRALSLLDAFGARYPSSSLLEEAAVLRFDAWLALDASRARADGEAFLRHYPRSAYAERVRVRLLEIR